MTEEKFHYREKLRFLRKRCPKLSEEELKAAEEAFIDYIRLASEIWDSQEPFEEDWKIYREDMERLRNSENAAE